MFLYGKEYSSDTKENADSIFWEKIYLNRYWCNKRFLCRSVSLLIISYSCIYIFYASRDRLEKAFNKNVHKIFQFCRFFHYCLYTFSTAKKKWKSIVKTYFQETGRRSIRKIDFPKLLNKLFINSFTINSVSGGFRRSGIWPHNMEAMKDKVYHPRSSHNNSIAT